MQTNFQILFSVKVAHSYFKNGICNCLQFIPKAATEHTLNKYGFKLKESIDGFSLFSGSDLAAGNFLDYIKTASGRDSFEFDINTNDADFIYFTELPADRLWQMEYKSNDPLNSTEGSCKVLHLALTGQKIAPVIGNLKIYFDDILRPGRKDSGVNYMINLKARSTQWQYYIINKSAVSLNNPSISGKNSTNFKGPENVKLENGEEALFFYSGEEDLPLSQIPVPRFDLINKAAGNTGSTTKKSSAAKIIFKGLPNPDPSDMGTTMLDGKVRSTSPMYIYI